MRFSFFIWVFINWACNAQVSNKVSVKAYDKDSVLKHKKMNQNEFRNVFENFFVDNQNRFYIKSFGHDQNDDGSLKLVEVFVEFPLVDSATYINHGNYIVDKQQVICVFENSDGGNYIKVNSADSKTFKPFKNVFGGKDNYHVYFQNKILDLDPSKVKAYSNLKDCSNCIGYFTDGKTYYYGTEKIVDSTFSIPAAYKIEE